MIEISNRKAGCPAPVQLELLAAGDEVPAEVKAHASTCASCQPFVQALQGAAEAYRRARPSEQMLQKLSRRATESARRPGILVGWRSLALLGWTALGALLLVQLGVFKGPRENALRLKGAPEAGLSIYVEHAAQPQRDATQIFDGAAVRPGDSLRFQYHPPVDGYLLVVDVDGTGQLTVFHPYGSTQAAPISAAADPLLPDAVKLDASSGPERIAAILRPTPFTLADVRGWLGPIPLQRLPELHCADCRVQWVTLQKQ